jgi:RNA polymerase sigma-70 factor (ECF subfamily)
VIRSAPDRTNDLDRDASETAQAAALEAIFLACYDDLYLTAYRFLTSRALAEEVIQDVFLTMWDRRDRWGRGELRDLKQYLFAAVRNRALSRLRRERLEHTWQQHAVASRHDPGLSAFASAASAEPDDDPELTAQLERAMAALPPRARETLLLRIRRDLTHAEIAATMGITVKAVERNLGRAIRALREALGPAL